MKKVIPPKIFLDAKDLAAFFPKASISVLRKKNTELKAQIGKGRNDRLTVDDIPRCLPIDFETAVGMLQRNT